MLNNMFRSHIADNLNKIKDRGLTRKNMNETAIRNFITINNEQEKNLFCSVFKAFCHVFGSPNIMTCFLKLVRQIYNRFNILSGSSLAN